MVTILRCGTFHPAWLLRLRYVFCADFWGVATTQNKCVCGKNIKFFLTKFNKGIIINRGVILTSTKILKGKCKMKKQKKVLEAVVSGVVKWDDNRPFEAPVRFTMVPSEREHEYGTGYYMMVQVLGETPIEVAYYDMRYVGTSDIRKVARIAAKEYWGENLLEFREV